MSTTHITASNKTALVTGGARRIGRVIALALAQRGWDVAVHYVRSAVEAQATRSEEHTSELQSLMRISYAVFCLKKKNTHQHNRAPQPKPRNDTGHIHTYTTE